MRRAISARLGRTGHAHGDVGVAPQQVLVAIVEREFEFDAWMFAPEIGEDLRQHFSADHLARGHAHDAMLGRRFAGRRAGQRSSGGGHCLRVRQEAKGGLRRDQPARRTREQR